MSTPQTAPAAPALVGVAGVNNAAGSAGRSGPAALIVAAHRRPGCNARPGERCTTRSGRPARIHILRIGEAKHAAAPGPCPYCGDQLVISQYRISHVGTGEFGCTP